MRIVTPRSFSTAVWPDWTRNFPSPEGDSRESGQKAIKKALGANAKSAPKGLFYGLVAGLAGILPTKPPLQEDSREFGHKAVEKAFESNAKCGPKRLLYGLVAQLAGILTTNPPHQEDSREFGH
jgi:hypothetical protein